MCPPHPFDAWSLREAAQGLLLVTAALETGLLSLLESERSAAELAATCALDVRAVRICLGALEELGVVERGESGFRLTEFGRSRFVAADSPGYVGADLSLWRANLVGWLFLEDVLRSGRNLPEADTPGYRARLCRSLAAKPPGRVARLVDGTLARSSVARPRVLDVGGGAGTHARAFAARGCPVTLLDRPEILEHAREALEPGRFSGVELVAGDFTTALPEGPFEAVLLADVVHLLDAASCRALLGRIAAVGGPGAVVAIADSFRDRSAGAAWLALTMLLYTPGGNTYTEAELRGWVAEAGFVDPLVEDLDPGHALLTARLGSAASRRSD